MNEPAPKMAHSIQVQAHVWGNPDPRMLPPDVRAIMNPAPQVPNKNDKNHIVPARFDLGRE